MELPIDIEFKLTEQEFLREVRRTIVRHPFTWVLAVFTAAFAGLLFITIFAGSRWSRIWILLTPAGAIYLYYLLMILPQRAYDSLNPVTRDSQVHYRFTSTGVEAKLETFQARWDWTLIGHFTELKDSFVIYPKFSENCFLLPKRANESSERMDSLRNLLKTHLRSW